MGWGEDLSMEFLEDFMCQINDRKFAGPPWPISIDGVERLALARPTASRSWSSATDPPSSTDPRALTVSTTAEPDHSSLVDSSNKIESSHEAISAQYWQAGTPDLEPHSKCQRVLVEDEPAYEEPDSDLDEPGITPSQEHDHPGGLDVGFDTEALTSAMHSYLRSHEGEAAGHLLDAGMDINDDLMIRDALTTVEDRGRIFENEANASNQLDEHRNVRNSVPRLSDWFLDPALVEQKFTAREQPTIPPSGKVRLPTPSVELERPQPAREHAGTGSMPTFDPPQSSMIWIGRAAPKMGQKEKQKKSSRIAGVGRRTRDFGRRVRSSP